MDVAPQWQSQRLRDEETARHRDRDGEAEPQAETAKEEEKENEKEGERERETEGTRKRTRKRSRTRMVNKNIKNIRKINRQAIGLRIRKLGDEFACEPNRERVSCCLRGRA